MHFLPILAQTDIDTIIFNDKNEKIFYAKELVDDDCLGCCYSPKALFDMKVFDSFDNEVLYLARENQFQCSRITRRSPVSLNLCVFLKNLHHAFLIIKIRVSWYSKISLKSYVTLRRPGGVMYDAKGKI